MDAVKKLYRRGLSLRKISAETGLPRETTRLLMIKSGMSLRKSRRDKAVRYHRPRFSVSPESAELVAMHAGDGELGTDGSWSLTSFHKDVQLVCRVRTLVRRVVGVEPNTYHIENKMVVSSGQGQTTEYFSRYFPAGRKSHTVAVPEAFLSSRDPEVARSLLIGLYSTDGSFSLRRDGRARVEFRVRSRRLRDQFVGLSGGFGFGLNSTSPMSRGSPMYAAYTEDQRQVKKWMETIGSRCDTHNRRYGVWLKRGSPSLVNGANAGRQRRLQKLVA